MKETKERFSVSLTKSTSRYVKDLAQKEQRSYANMIEVIISEYRKIMGNH